MVMCEEQGKAGQKARPFLLGPVPYLSYPGSSIVSHEPVSHV